MTGVTSKDSKASKAPLNFKGARPGPGATGTADSVVIEGAMIVERNLLVVQRIQNLEIQS